MPVQVIDLENGGKCIKEEDKIGSYEKTSFYNKDGELHREDGPAVETQGYADKAIYREYRQNGELHREDGPAVEMDGEFGEYKCEYRQHGQLHREDGPAVIDSSAEHQISKYYKNGKLHREDGPAVEKMDYCYATQVTTKKQEWHVNGEQVNPIEQTQAFQQSAWQTADSCPFCDASYEDGFERTKLDGDEEYFGREVEHVQCESCIFEFGIVDFDTKEVVWTPEEGVKYTEEDGPEPR